jgi:hypothetical protein
MTAKPAESAAADVSTAALGAPALMGV